MQKITKGTSLDFHNVAMNKTNHINNFYRGYLQDVDFFVVTWANNIRICLPNSTYIFLETGSRQLPCRQGSSEATLPSRVVQDRAHKGAHTPPPGLVTESQLGAVFTQKRNPHAHNSTVRDSTRDIHVSQVTS